MRKTDSILDKIISEKQEELSKSKSAVSESQLSGIIANQRRQAIDFYKAIKSSSLKYKIIGEIKQSSPSAGTLRENFQQQILILLINRLQILLPSQF